MKRYSVLALLLVASAFAQTPPSPSNVSAAAEVYPAYLVAMGGGYTRNNGIPNVSEAWVAAFVNLGGSMYSKTTIDMTSINTIRTGFCKVFSTSGNWMLGSCVDAGVQNVTPVIGSFSGGGFMTYDLKGISPRLAGMKFLVELRVTGATATATTVTTVTNPTTGIVTTTTTGPAQGATSLVTPGLFIGIGKTF